MSRREIISVSFVVILLVSNILATKLIAVGPLILPAAVIIYPFTFMIGDILSEVWGYRYAKQVIYLGFIANFFMVIFTYIGGLLNPAPTWLNQSSYEAIFGLVPRIVLGSFIAYLIGELLNSWVLIKIRNITGQKLFFIRTIGSTIIGQFFDTAIFITIAFFGTLPTNVFLRLLIGQYAVKVILEAFAGTPLAYILVSWVKGNSNLSVNGKYKVS